MSKTEVTDYEGVEIDEYGYDLDTYIWKTDEHVPDLIYEGPGVGGSVVARVFFNDDCILRFEVHQGEVEFVAAHPLDTVPLSAILVYYDDLEGMELKHLSSRAETKLDEEDL